MAKKYYPRAYKRLLLQDRDLQVMNYCLEQRFLTVDQIARHFFQEVKKRLKKAYERVLVLQRFGLLKLVPLLLGQKVVQTTELGATELANRGYDPLPVQPVDYRIYEHDRRVTDVRIVFEQLGLITAWTSERHLKQRFVRVRRVPDAVFTLTNGQTVALEVEIARKGKPRYRRIFQDYYEERLEDVDLLFYVCDRLPQLNSLVELTKGYRWIYFGLYELLMHQGVEAVFVNCHDHFRLKEIPKSPQEAS